MSKMYYLYDGHGSVERVHGKDGSSCKLMYDTYGNLTAGIIEQWNIWYNDIFAHRTTMIYAYSGEAYNCISELQYLRARWYDTETGRFLSEDRYLGNQRQPLTRNRYLYTCNNPMNYVDPSGYKAVAQDVGGFGVMRQSALTGGVGLALATLLEETKKKVKAQKNTNRQNNNSSDKQLSTSQTLTNASSSPLAGVTQATMDSLAQKVEEAKNRQENDLCEIEGENETGEISELVVEVDILNQLTVSNMLKFGWNAITEDEVVNLKEALKKYGILSKKSIILFLATCLVESNYGKSILEEGDEDYFKDKKYTMEERGVGYIQLTHKESHLDYLAYVEGVENGRNIYSGTNTAEYIAKHYDPWDISAYVWAEKKHGAGVVLNEYVNSKYDSTATENGNLFEIFLVLQYFINSYKDNIDDDLRDIRKGIKKYSIDEMNNKLVVLNDEGMVVREHELPQGWIARKKAYEDAIKIFN